MCRPPNVGRDGVSLAPRMMTVGKEPSGLSRGKLWFGIVRVTRPAAIWTPVMNFSVTPSPVLSATLKPQLVPSPASSFLYLLKAESQAASLPANGPLGSMMIFCGTPDIYIERRYSDPACRRIRAGDYGTSGRGLGSSSSSLLYLAPGEPRLTLGSMRLSRHTSSKLTRSSVIWGPPPGPMSPL